MSKEGPNVALFGVRADTPEMQAVFEEIRSDLESILGVMEIGDVDVEYLTAAAIGIARDLGDHMLQRQPVDVEAAATFASELLLKGLSGVLVTD